MQHEMTPNDNQVALPELPEPQKEVEVAGPHDAEVREALEDYFDADQLRVYATEAVRLNELSGNSGQLPAGGEAVAEVGPGWTLRFVGSTPIAELCRQHPELRIGTKLYTHPAADALGAVRETGRLIRDWLVPLELGDYRYLISNYNIETLAAALAQAPAVQEAASEEPDFSFIANALLDFADDLESQGLANGALRHQAKLLKAALGQGKANG